MRQYSNRDILLSIVTIFFFEEALTSIYGTVVVFVFQIELKLQKEKTYLASS